ncbi:hypothetical protein C0992_002366 [Termitomyces sp. T32_za158]|nr:hypothetical protein C0992_002366 [Termitomyces sp. T32_za158]
MKYKKFAKSSLGQTTPVFNALQMSHISSSMRGSVTTRLRDTASTPRKSSRPRHNPAAAIPPPTALPPSQTPKFPETPALTPAISASTLIDPTQP